MPQSAEWAFHNEDETVLAEQGFGFTGNEFFPDNAVIYTYSGDQVAIDGNRWSMRFGVGEQLDLPARFMSPNGHGWINVVVRSSTGEFGTNFTNDLIAVVAPNGSRVIVRKAADRKSLQLYVDNVLKATTSPFDWDSWRTVALQYDISTATWEGRIYVDAVAATALFTDPAPLGYTSGTINMQSLTGGPLYYLAQIRAFDDKADLGYTVRHVSLLPADAIGSTTGVWTGVVGNVDKPFNSATEIENAAVTTGDRIEFTLSGDLATKLGTTPSNIDKVSANFEVNGDSLSGFARVRSGAFETTGNTEVIASVGQSFVGDGALVDPDGGGAWAPTDQPSIVFEAA